MWTIRAALTARSYDIVNDIDLLTFCMDIIRRILHI